MSHHHGELWAPYYDEVYPEADPEIIRFLLAYSRRPGRALELGVGTFVLDCFVPDPTRFDAQGTRMGVSSISSDRSHAYELSVHEAVDQIVFSHHVRRLEDGSTVVLPVTVRYAWPSEMGLMARIADLELEGRFGWYDRNGFNSGSHQHVSVYRKPG